MLEALKQIKNTMTRMAVAAATAGSIVTFGAAIAIGVTNSKSESAQKSALYASLIGTGGGALVGLLSGKTNLNKVQPEAEPTEMDSFIWRDWRNFIVVRKVKESEEITSFYLKPEDGGEIPLFRPGQFLTIQLNIPGQQKTIIRTYSLSDYTNDYYRLSIKREPKPKGLEVPPGVASNFMHDVVQEGDVISVKPPNGNFFIDVQKSLPAVLISNGVGITPMISMVNACYQLNPDRPIWFLHGTRDGAFHAFREEVLTLAQQNANLQVHFCYSRPRPEDQAYYHSEGYVDAVLIQQQVVPQLEKLYGSTDAEYFLCGSPPFLQSLREGLQERGVPQHRILFESFGGRKVAIESKSATQEQDDQGYESEIVFEKSDHTFIWQPGDGTILEFAEENGLEPAYSCRQGICLTCMCQLKSGEIEYETPPIGTPDEGSVLICIAKPKTAHVVLDL